MDTTTKTQGSRATHPWLIGVYFAAGMTHDVDGTRKPISTIAEELGVTPGEVLDHALRNDLMNAPERVYVPAPPSLYLAPTTAPRVIKHIPRTWTLKRLEEE